MHVVHINVHRQNICTHKNNSWVVAVVVAVVAHTFYVSTQEAEAAWELPHQELGMLSWAWQTTAWSK